MLRIDNNNAGASATALDVRVEPGKPPFKVNSATRVANLNADRIDGKDSTALVPTEIYTLDVPQQGGGGGQQVARSVFCDQGDVLLSGGHSIDPGDNLILSSSFDSNTAGSGWTVVVEDNGAPTRIFAQARCADLPPLR
jgi:hypothetical protein